MDHAEDLVEGEAQAGAEVVDAVHDVREEVLLFVNGVGGLELFNRRVQKEVKQRAGNNLSRNGSRWDGDDGARRTSTGLGDQQGVEVERHAHTEVADVVGQVHEGIELCFERSGL